MHESVDSAGRVLIIQARDDEDFNERQQNALVDLYPGARTQLFETGGHLLTFTRGEEIGNIIQDYLTV
jgi:pimeloyl-ACP methyl ester carboxylesterase